MNAQDCPEDLGRIIRRQRVISGLTIRELSTMSGVSPSHLARVERGERFPSARVLRKIANPLGFSEDELFILADYLPAQSSGVVENGMQLGRLDANVAWALSQEPAELQRAMLAIFTALKLIATGIAPKDRSSSTEK